MPARPVPQDHKQKARKQDVEDFTFTGLDGVEYTLPPASAITSGMIRKNRNLSELDLSFTVLEQIVDADTLAALDNLPLEQFNEVLGGWQKHIGVTPGK